MSSTGPWCGQQFAKCILSQGYIVLIWGTTIKLEVLWLQPSLATSFPVPGHLEISCLGFLASWGPPGGWMWTIHLAGCLCKSWLLSKSPVFEWKPQLPKNRAHTFILCSKLSMTNASEVLPMSAGRCCLLNIYIVVTVWLARYRQTLHTISVLTLCTRKQTREMGQLS